MTTTVRVFAPAKINLFLHVTGRRADGYHLLDSLAAFADIGDDVTVTADDKFSVSLSGPFADALTDSDANSCLRAARFAADLARPPTGRIPSGARISLVKNLPVAAGLGGGSTDAAATLLACRALWNIRALPSDADVAGALGADVPVCLRARATMLRGIGEQLEDAPALPPCAVVLVNPGVALPTADVFKAFSGSFSRAVTAMPARWDSTDALANFLRLQRNDLTAAARTLAPEIGTVLSLLAQESHCRLARMSGSGATCYGLFAEATAAERAARRIAQARPRWWVKAGRLAEFPDEARVIPGP
ncbi:MAG: 4-(cytidine 5'-diphospho)-2-C-methyl-D-erythritol kinase [Rhodospirillaceae bacterium]|nr:4-(cytidine 5'-diphospho)-2-C-methyl-D-erythritol kinase [Rhodospirillaceae bacterium]